MKKNDKNPSWLNNRFLFNLLESLPSHVFWKDKEGIYLGCNSAFARSVGLEKSEDVVGKNDYDFPICREDSATYRTDDQEVMRSRQPKLNIEEKQVFKNGRETFLLTSKVPLFNKNKDIIGVLGVYSDITELKNTQKALLESKKKAELSSQTKTEFLENMRHDIRTPLTGITGFAEIIKQEVTDPKIKEYADNLIASSHSLLDLLNEVLEAIKVSSGEIPLLKKKFNLQQKLNEIILLNQAKALHKGIDLSLQYDAAIPTYLIGDSTRIHRVVLELVSNALNFTHKGYVKLSAQLAKDNEDDVVIKIIVDDTGVGIATEKQQDIYVQFKRLTPSYEGIYAGSGLGLSIAKQFIDDMNGEIYVQSQVGAGSTFTVIVKLKKALLDEELGSEQPTPLLAASKLSPVAEATKGFDHAKSGDCAAGDTATPYKSRILVVEDNPLAAGVVSGLLSNMDCTVDVAEKGKLAVQLAEEHPYDLIFMDIGLPDIDGYETTKRIRLNEIKKRHVPIIALTAHAGEENKKQCIDIGMNAVLTKPLAKEKAADILNSFIPYRLDRLKAAQQADTSKDTSDETELTVFDMELIQQQFGGQTAAIGMVNMFLEDLPEELTQLQAAYHQKDWATVKNLTHKFKGGVSYCGAMRLEAACFQLEQAIREGKNELFEPLYAQLLTEMSLAEKAMREKLS